MNISTLTWAQRARLQAIESIAYWVGRINTRDITDRFGVSRMIAQRDIKHYINLAPGNLSYSPTARAYLVTSIFKPLLTQGLINEYLSLDAQNNPSLLDELVTKVQPPTFELDPNIIRPVIRAIQKKSGVKIRYRSLTHPNGTDRILFPHRLVNTGFRWHVRAYCDLRKNFRDFNLSRIVNSQAVDLLVPEEANSNHDGNWSTLVKLKIKANPLLSKNEIALIEQEFTMKCGILEVECRAALIPYTLQSFQIDTKTEPSSNPRQYRLVLDNKESLAQFLW